MTVYSFADEEFYDLRHLKKEALKVAQETNEPVLVTKTVKRDGREPNHSWYTMYPDGRYECDRANANFNN